MSYYKIKTSSSKVVIFSFRSILCILHFTRLHIGVIMKSRMNLLPLRPCGPEITACKWEQRKDLQRWVRPNTPAKKKKNMKSWIKILLHWTISQLHYTKLKHIFLLSGSSTDGFEAFLFFIQWYRKYRKLFFKKVFLSSGIFGKYSFF